MVMVILGYGCGDELPDKPPVMELTVEPPQVTANVGEDFEIIAALKNGADVLMGVRITAGSNPYGMSSTIYVIEHGEVMRDVPAGGTVNVAFSGTCLSAGATEIWVLAEERDIGHGASLDRRASATIPVTCVDDSGTGGSGGTGAGGGTGGTGGTGGQGGAGGGGGTVSIPPHTATGCTVDANGCLNGDATTCEIELDALLDGAAVDGIVEGAIKDDLAGHVAVIFYAYPPGPEWRGYRCEAIGAASGGWVALKNMTGAQVDSQTWDAPSSGDSPISLDVSFDPVAESGTCAFTAGVTTSTTPLEGTAMGTPTTMVAMITAFRAKVCNISLSSP